MRRFALLVLALAAPAFAGGADPSLATVHVSRAQGGGVSVCGSGTVIRSEGGTSWVLTNHHVAGDGPVPRSVQVGGLSLPARLVAVDDRADLALLEVRADLVAAELADEEPPAGADVRQWGFPAHAGGARCPKAGRARGLIPGMTEDTGAPVWATTIDSQSGDSGAGVFHLGRLVAVNWGKPKFASGQLACPLASVRRFLGRALGE